MSSSSSRSIAVSVTALSLTLKSRPTTSLRSITGCGIVDRMRTGTAPRNSQIRPWPEPPTTTRRASAPAERPPRPRPRSRPEALDGPGTAFAPVTQPVVEAVVAVLPELPHLRPYAEAAPLPGEGRVVAVLGAHRVDETLQLVPPAHDPALRRGGRRHAAERRPRPKIRLGVGARGPLDRSLDADLAPERSPVEEQRGVRVGGQLAALAALVAGVEHEPLLAEALDEHHARRRTPVGRRRRHGGLLGDRHRLAGVPEPPPE